MAKRPGEVGVKKAATILECSTDYVYEQAREALSGGESIFQAVRRDVTRRYWFKESEVRDLAHRLPTDASALI